MDISDNIAKIKDKIKSALRKFDLNSRDLERIDDIILEIEIQVKALDLQLKRFKRHEKLTSCLLYTSPSPRDP